MDTKVISGGGKLEDALKQIGRDLGRGGTLRVGFLPGATYDDGTPVATVAAIQDFGAPAQGIPPRPFFRNMVAGEKAGWPEAISRDLLRTGYNAEQTLNRMGALIAGQLRQSIATFEGVPLKPATIRRKGFNKQLVDTGHMLASVDFEVDTN